MARGRAPSRPRCASCASRFRRSRNSNRTARLTIARSRKGKVFAIWALNHHGDGHVALWLNTPALEQSRLLASSRHIFKPPYVGPSGWIAVELNKGVSLEAGLRARAHGLREQLARETRRAECRRRPRWRRPP